MIDIELLKSRVNCIDVAAHFLSLPIHKSGDRCVSPLRSGAKNKTSFMVTEDFFYDFGSGSGGDCIDLLALAKYRGDKGQAIKELADYAGIHDSSYDTDEWRKHCARTNDLVHRWHEELPPSYRDYLHSRNINDETIEKLLIGKCDDGRLCIPYIKNGNIVYYITRSMPDSLYPNRKYQKMKIDGYCEHVVWGLDSLNRGGDTLVIAEGAFDVMSFWQEGYPCLSAITGHFSKAQQPTVFAAARNFKRVMLTYDNDPVTHAGEKFTVKMAKLLLSERINFTVGNVPAGYKDISEYYADGGNLDDIVRNAQNGISFLAQQMTSEDEFEKFVRNSARFMTQPDLVKLFLAVQKNFNQEWLSALKTDCKKPPTEDFVAKEVLRKHKLKFNRKIGFFLYNGKYWKEIGDEVVHSFIAEEMGIHRTGNKLSSIIKVIKSATVTEEIFNTKQVVNFINGTLELEPRVKFREHSDADNVTYCLNYPYDETAKSDEWLKFLFDITDHDGKKVDLFQEACGYTLYSDNKYQTAFFLIGSGSNGKSVFLSILSKIFGQENITNVEMSALAQDFQRVQLSSSILNISTETKSDVNGAESYFKQIVAGDMISACYKGKPYFSFTPRAKLWISCNDFIKPKDTSDGFMRRLKFINFPIRFCDEPQEENEKPVDRNIEDRLSTSSNLSGIFNWVLQGYIELKQQGRFSEPDDERDIKEEFKELTNPVLTFVKEYSLPEPTFSVNNKQLYDEYKEWCDDNGHNKLGGKRFAKQVARYFKEYRKDIEQYKSKTERGYRMRADQ